MSKLTHIALFVVLVMPLGCVYGPEHLPALRTARDAHLEQARVFAEMIVAIEEQHGIPHALGAAGGGSRDPSSETSSTEPPAIEFQTEVISDPPGAHIEVDGDYVGEAPLTVKWTGEEFRGKVFNERVHDIVAIPNGIGQFVQTKTFYGSGSLVHRRAFQKIPARVFFNMSLAPATPVGNVR